MAVQKPFGGAADYVTIVQAEDQSVVTSGTYERYFEKDGVIYHHIFDPETGYPVQNGLTSVTIVSDTSADGDALSTACFVLGLDKGMELVESLEGIEALCLLQRMRNCIIPADFLRTAIRRLPEPENQGHSSTMLYY